MIELAKDTLGGVLGGEKGSRKAQAFVGGVALAMAVPEQSWQIVALTAAYILGRAWHDAYSVPAE